MKLFIDTANVEEIRKANELGIICGVTTNPSLIAREGKVFEEVIKEITTIVDGPISADGGDVLIENCTVTGGSVANANTADTEVRLVGDTAAPTYSILIDGAVFAK